MDAEEALAKMREMKNAAEDIRSIVNTAKSESDLGPALERARSVTPPN